MDTLYAKDFSGNTVQFRAAFEPVNSLDPKLAFRKALSAGIASVGTFTANGATAVTVTDANIAATSLVIISLNTVGGSVGAIPHLATITAGTSFTTVGTASDTSTYNYAIINP